MMTMTYELLTSFDIFSL